MRSRSICSNVDFHIVRIKGKSRFDVGIHLLSTQICCKSDKKKKVSNYSCALLYCAVRFPIHHTYNCFCCGTCYKIFWFFNLVFIFLNGRFYFSFNSFFFLLHSLSVSRQMMYKKAQSAHIISSTWELSSLQSTSQHILCQNCQAPCILHQHFSFHRFWGFDVVFV